MGTFLGHLMPAFFFFFYCLYYSVLVSLALLRKQRVLKLPLPPKEKRRRWQLVPMEGVVKVVITTIGIVLEFFFPPGVNRLVIIDWKDPRRPFLFKDNWHHITMYGFFLLSGVADIVSHSCRARPCVKLERAAEALAFYVLALMMASHLENKNSLEIRVHILFMVPVLVVAMVVSVEVWVPDQPQLWVLKAWMGLVLSSWLMQLSVLLYTPLTGQPWRADNPTDLAFLSIFFCWHLALGIAILAATYGLCSLWHHRYSSWTEASNARYQLCPTDSRGEELEKLQAEVTLQEGGI
ncbi:transmembrane epididymal protein 1A-like [Ochotona curzoniae]|uniref:transmembrane epididymal protein 1A-like n=1 Tax=Ochotona curzoniae TaxID=130825 RepID=UPI001B35165C|nr:transmembrane epididymal protein 1A-like [Ochotona curzoniae]